MEHTLNALEVDFDSPGMDDEPELDDQDDDATLAESTYDERYAAKEQAAFYDMVLSAEKLLSHEMGDERYLVHKPEQQQKWGFLKWDAQKRLAQLLFTFKTPWLFLKSDLGGDVVVELPDIADDLLMDLDDDDQPDAESDVDSDDSRDAKPKNKINKKKKLVGIVVDGATGIRVNFAPSRETYAALVQLIDIFMSGDGKWTRSELVEMLTEDYHLSYCHFIRGHAARLMKSVGELMSASSHDQEKFAVSEGLTWQQCVNLRRLMQGEHYAVITNRNRLVETNMRAALHVATQRHRMTGGSKPCMEKLDLVTEACLGLMHAADLYIPKCTARFTTYAMNWMNQRAGRYIKNNNPIRLPLHISEQIVCVTSSVMSIIQDRPEFTHGQLPPKREVEAFLTKKRGRRVVISPLLWKLSEAKIRGLPHCVGGLDLNGGTELPNDTYVCEMNEESDQDRDMKIMVQQIFNSNKLTDLQKQILRYSIMEPDAIEDLSAHLGVKKEKIRTERKKALKKAGSILRELSVDVSRFFSDDYVGKPILVSSAPAVNATQEAGDEQLSDDMDMDVDEELGDELDDESCEENHYELSRRTDVLKCANHKSEQLDLLL